MPEPSCADDALVRSARRGDEQAWRALVDDHHRLVRAAVVRVIGAGPDVEDVIQDAFLQAHGSLRGFEGRARFSSWLYRLATNVARMHRRRGRSRPRCVAEPPWEAAMGHDEETPERALERAERVRALARLIADLPDAQRAVLLLHDFQGVPSGEIAESLGIPRGTVRTRLFYARQALYGGLADEPSLSDLPRPRWSAEERDAGATRRSEASPYSASATRPR